MEGALLYVTHITVRLAVLVAREGGRWLLRGHETEGRNGGLGENAKNIAVLCRPRHPPKACERANRCSPNSVVRRGRPPHAPRRPRRPRTPPPRACAARSGAKPAQNQPQWQGQQHLDLRLRSSNLPPKDPQTPQTHPAHSPARGPKRRGDGRRGKGAHLLADPLAAPPAPRGASSSGEDENCRRGRRPPPRPAATAPPAVRDPEALRQPTQPSLRALAATSASFSSSLAAAAGREAPDDPRQPDPGARPRCRTRPVPGRHKSECG